MKIYCAYIFIEYEGNSDPDYIATLLQWAAEAEDQADKDVIGCEVMYR